MRLEFCPAGGVVALLQTAKKSFFGFVSLTLDDYKKFTICC